MGLDIKTYVGSVAHAIHSLNLESIRQIFDQDATEENNIPTLKLNLSDPNPIQDHVTLAGFDTSIKSFSFQVMDFIFSNDHPQFMNVNETSVEKLSHAFHMIEIWTKAQNEYNRLISDPPTADFCSCATDVFHPGIVSVLRVVWSNLSKINGEVYGYGAFELTCDHVNRNKRDPSKCKRKRSASDEVDDNEFNEDRWIPGSTNDYKRWPLLKKMLVQSLPPEDEINMFASYMYCKLNN